MATKQQRSEFAVSLAELERTTRVPVEDQVTEQAITDREPAISEYDLRLGRLLGIEHAG
ncbi:hypothetical protein [Kineosporia succinea]|uniref:Uncharacterized protein n=1 Tax=Kineosporia succinea TaxID=84632 RepID=A0ABT9NZC9_9ACTN|nr:hypothetical protein [Kineosporia succinea]MDP9825802.1 hypothetical protein [Kineosporia succinea]